MSPFPFNVTMVRKEKSLVNRCAVPYGIPKEKELEKWIVTDDLITNFGCELIVDEVEEIDRDAKTIHLKDGKKDLSYDILIIGTGAKPIVPPIPGVDGKNIVTVRQTEDLEKLRSFAATGKNVVVIGGGYIGMEIADSCKGAGLDVTLIEMLPHALLATMDDEFALEVEKAAEKDGIKLHTGRRATEFVQNEDKMVTSVKMDNGEEAKCDFVVLSIGVAPELQLAKKAGLEVSPLGIVVDDAMKTSDPSIYAGGDVIQKKSFITQKPCRGEFGTTAVFMAKVLAMNVAQSVSPMPMPENTFPGVINANASRAFGYSFGSAGLIEKMAKQEYTDDDIICGTSTVLNRYPMMDDATPIQTKLVFRKSEGYKLIGGSVFSKDRGISFLIDLISYAIQKGSTMMELLTLQYSTHPELASRPSENAIVMACFPVMKQMQQEMMQNMMKGMMGGEQKQ
jgi:NADH oxidase (H2O2-forming)